MGDSRQTHRRRRRSANQTKTASESVRVFAFDRVEGFVAVGFPSPFKSLGVWCGVCYHPTNDCSRLCALIELIDRIMLWGWVMDLVTAA